MTFEREHRPHLPAWQACDADHGVSARLTGNWGFLGREEAARGPDWLARGRLGDRFDGVASAHVRVSIGLRGSIGPPVKPPIIVVADDASVRVFPDADQAVRLMEAIDVLNGEYRVFDAEALRLVLHADSDEGPIEIREGPGRQPEPAEVRRLLRGHVRRLQDARPALVEIGSDELDGLDLAALVELIETTERRFQETSFGARLRRFVSAVGRRPAGR